MSRSHANPPRTQDQQDDVNSEQPEDIPVALHAASNEMEALRLVNQRLLRELAELTKCSDHKMNNRTTEAATPYHKRSNNTSTPPETITEEEKIIEPEGRIPTYPSETIETKERLTGTMESRPLIRGEQRNDLGSDGSKISNKSSAT